MKRARYDRRALRIVINSERATVVRLTRTAKAIGSIIAAVAKRNLGPAAGTGQRRSAFIPGPGLPLVFEPGSMVVLSSVLGTPTNVVLNFSGYLEELN